MRRFYTWTLGATFACALILGGGAHGAFAASKAAASKTSPSPAPTPTETPEPANIAIPRLEAELKKNPNDKTVLVKLASYYLASDHADKALPLTQKLISLGEKTAQVYYIEGIANEQLGKVPEATSALEQASNLDPTNAQVLLALTDLYIRTNKEADAERVAKRAVTFNGKDAHVLINYALVLAHEKKYDEARSQLEAAYKLNLKDVTPLILEAHTYEAQQAFALAQQVYDRAVTVDPSSVDALLGRARVLGQEHMLDRAIAQYEQLRGIVGDDFSKAGILDEEAHLYATEKKESEAAATFKKAASLYTKVPEAHLAYGDYLATQKKFSDAVSEWNAALGDKKDDRDALFRLGNYYLQTGDAKRAVENFKRLDELTSNDPRPSFLLAESYMGERQFHEARDSYRKSFEIAKTPDALAGIAAADFQLGNYKEAASIFDSIDKNGQTFIKQNPAVLFLMGKAYAANHESAKAKTAYTQFLGFVKNDAKTTADVKKLIADLDRSSSPPKPASKKKK